MIVEKSKEMMGKAFDKVMYEYREVPEMKLSESYGIYINVPFCKQLCSFCPFYKVKYKESLKDQYVDRLVAEIRQSEITASPNWVYFGGGTPNLLSIDDLKLIVQALKSKVGLQNLGIELHPNILSDDYIFALHDIGFAKLSMGVESFSSKVNDQHNRMAAKGEKIKHWVRLARELKMFVNLDIMTGLKGQDEMTFLKDIEILSKIKASQVTTYPYMIIRGLNNDASMTEEKQFESIEKAWKILSSAGYKRMAPWNFTCDDGLYDSSKDELVDDYVGFGAASFSTYNNWKIVNPEMDIYLNGFLDNRKALLAPKTKSTDDWRLFARMISDLKLQTSTEFPFYINSFIRLLKWTGFGRNGELNEKGIMFAHHITKKVVESLPFPIQNASRISNFSEYKKNVE